MMKTKQLSIIIFLISLALSAQNYNPLSYYFNGTPNHGIKIKTNIPFQNGIAMPTVMLEGFEYGGGNVIDIKLNWYVFYDGFYIANASSSGSYNPPIKLTNDGGKVTIYIDDKKYYTRFNVRVYAYGKGENDAMFEGWVAVDEPISGTDIKDVVYKTNDLSGMYYPLKYDFGGTPTHGIKVKTNIPFRNYVGMPTVILEGYDFGGGNIIDIKIGWYVQSGVFTKATASSSGSYTPDIKLTNDGGKVSIYIDDKRYFSRFNVRVYAQRANITPAMFDGWTAVDEPISGSNITDLVYRNTFGGNVGIGTDVTDSKLRVEGSKSLARFKTEDDGFFEIQATRSNTESTATSLKLSSQNHIILDPNASDTPGNVGIGTTNPDMKLTVRGSIHAEEVKIDLNVPVPDYVFKDDYRLRTLQEVETFIKQHSHLPEIPSEKEFKQNGIIQGEMNMNLLQKIEELTLYAIQQDKRLNRIECKNKTLKTENAELKSLNLKLIEITNRLDSLENRN